MQRRLLALYSAGHFLVDLSCAFVMLTLVADVPQMSVYLLLTYNFCAFALQMPLGIITDKLNRNALIAVAGFAITLLSFACYPVPLLCAVAAGVGNCLFHIGGGTDVLHFSETKEWMLGVFVSPGAIGLFVGGLLAQNRVLSIPHGFALTFFIAALLTLGLHLTRSVKRTSENPPPSIRPNGRMPILAFICLFLVVVLRSYVGMTQTFSWRAGVWVPLTVAGLAFGKAVGGILADCFGALRISIITLSAASILYVFSAYPVCGLLAIFLFNMTMPLTLFAVSRLFPGARGFAFGTLTFALFLGYLPAALSLPIPFAGSPWWYAAEALLSLGLLTVGLLTARKEGGEPHA